MNARTKKIIAGILAANALALGVALLTWILFFLTGGRRSDGNDNPFVFVASDFILVPMAMGAVTAYVWRDLDLKRQEAAGGSFVSLLLGCALSAIVLREGTICLLMALPLVVTFQWVGYRIGKALANRKSRPLNATLAPLFLLLITANVLTTRGYDGAETDRIVIHAPARKVWRYLAGYPAIAAPPDYWLWRIGLPVPVQSTANGSAVGAARKCLFTGNVALDERITQSTPERELAFDVVSQPKDPEIVGHFTLHRGQFLLKDNGDGTTTLTGTSWYTLNVHPAVYYDLWVQDIVSHVHLRVMRHIKILAENAP